MSAGSSQSEMLGDVLISYWLNPTETREGLTVISHAMSAAHISPRRRISMLVDYINGNLPEITNYSVEQDLNTIPPHFGAALAIIRRTQSYRDDEKRSLKKVYSPLSSRTVIDGLADNGYPISSGAFSSIESNNSLPRDPEGFLTAIYAVLGTNFNEELGALLGLYLALGLMKRDLGKYEGLMEQVVPDGFEATVKARWNAYMDQFRPKKTNA